MKKDHVIDNIKSNYSKFTKTQRYIANYICENSRQIPAMSVQELAKSLNTSDASIIRFAQLLGYKGYLEMRMELKSEINEYYSPQSRFNRTMEGATTLNESIENKSMLDIVAQNDFECYEDFYHNFDKNHVISVANEINKANRIYLAGFGTDAVLSVFLNWYLQVLGYDSVCCKEGDFTISRQLNNIKNGDLLLLFATPRYLKIEKSILKVAKESGASTICISPDSGLELASLSDLSINISDRSNELINSYIPYMSFCNMLIMAVYESNKDVIDKKIKTYEDIEKYFDLFL